MNALMRENSEAFVTGNETIELSIASLREKMDRDHASLAASQAALAASQATLAANQTTLTANQAALSDRVHQNYTTLLEKIDTVHHVLRDKIEESNARIDAVGKDLSTAFAELRGFHKTVLWVCGGIVTVVTVSLSVAKSFGWI